MSDVSVMRTALKGVLPPKKKTLAFVESTLLTKTEPVACNPYLHVSARWGEPKDARPGAAESLAESHVDSLHESLETHHKLREE